MKPRQYKKLCKKAMEILVSGGMDKDDFSVEDHDLNYDVRCWGLNSGSAYSEDWDWYPAWHILVNQVACDTADWGSYSGIEDQDPYKTSIRGTRNILRHARKMHGFWHNPA